MSSKALLRPLICLEDELKFMKVIIREENGQTRAKFDNSAHGCGWSRKALIFVFHDLRLKRVIVRRI